MSVIGRNIFWLLASQLATWTATFLTLIIVPDRLGSTDFGAYGYAVGYVGLFTLVAGLGTSTYLSRAIARNHGLFGSYVWNAVLFKFVLWIVLSGMAIGIAVAIGNRGETLMMVMIGCAGMIFYILNEVFAGALAGMQRMARPAMWMVVQVYFQTIAGIAVLLLGWGVVSYATVMAFGVAIPAAGTAAMAWPLVRGSRVLDMAIWRLLVVGGVPLLALSFFNLIYGTVNVPILHSLSGSDPVGWFVLAMRWVGIPIFITTAVVSAYFPAFSQHGNPVTKEFAPLVNRAIHIVLFVSVPAGVGIGLVADDLVQLVYRRGDYDSSIVLMQLMAALTPVSALDTVLGSALVAADRLNRYLYIAGTAAAVNPIACVVLINFAEDRWGNGAIGAAIAMIATELWVMSGAIYLKEPGVLNRSTNGRLLRILVATAAMSAVVIAVGDAPLGVQVVLGVVSYGAASLLFGAISVTDLRQVARQVVPSGGRSRTVDDDGEGSADSDAGDGATDHPRVGGDLHP